MRIWIVESDEALRESLVLLFRTKGCAVQAFPSAEEAMRGLGPEPPEIVVSDQTFRAWAAWRSCGRPAPGTGMRSGSC